MNGGGSNWEHWRSFLAVVRGGSLSAGARVLTLTQPTVARHIDALEKTTGTALFTRSRNGLNPTPLAHALTPHAGTMAAAAENRVRRA